MIRYIIIDAIRNIITDDYIEHKLLINYNDNYNKRKVLTIINEIARCIADDKKTSVRNLAYCLEEGTINISRRESVMKILRIFAMLKQSEYNKHIIVTNHLKDLQFVLNFKLENLNELINLGSYKMLAHDINKVLYRMYPARMGIKYSMASSSLSTKLLNIVERYNPNTESTLEKISMDYEREKMRSMIRFYETTNTYMDNVRNFTVNKDGNMTCLPKGKRSVITNSNDQGAVWSKDNRQQMKYGKAVRYMFTRPHLPIISDKIIQDISQSLKSEYTFNATFEVVSGIDIQKYYHRSKYDERANTESLGSSCMRHTSCEDFFSIYVENANKCKMLIAKTDNGIIGRALLWLTDCNTKLMDRIYGNELTVNACKKWALDNGYMHKLKQGYTNDIEWVTSTGEIVADTYEITLCNKNNDYYPYMDTFKFANNIHSDVIIISNDECNDNYLLDSTDGGPSAGTLCVDGNRYDDDDVIYIDNGSVESGYYHQDDIFYCDWSDHYFHNDDGTETLDGCVVYCNHNDLEYLEYKDGYANSDNCIYSDFENQSYYIDDTDNCFINGIVNRDNIHTLTVEDKIYNVHETVSFEELIDHLS